MTVQGEFSVTFWGTRGSIACPGPATLRYGGNTSCLEVRCGDRRLIFDGGTGLPNLGRRILAETNGKPQELDLFLTHTHLDHIVGIPFFAPFHVPGMKLCLHAGHLLPNRTLKQTLKDMMAAPLFPIPPEIFQADVDFDDFNAGEDIAVSPDITVRTAPLNHPNGATGYRVEYAGKVFCYVTDTEHIPGTPDERILALIDKADVVVYDSTYTEEEFPRFIGYGHSTWAEGVRLVEAAGADRLFLFHHDPTHDDDFMDKVGQDAAAARPGTAVAQEGHTIII